MRERKLGDQAEPVKYALRWQHVTNCHRTLVIVAVGYHDRVHGFMNIYTYDEDQERLDQFVEFMSLVSHDTWKQMDAALAVWLDAHNITDADLSESGYELYGMLSRDEDVKYSGNIEGARVLRVGKDAPRYWNEWCAEQDRVSLRENDMAEYRQRGAAAATMDAWEDTLNDPIERHVAERRYDTETMYMANLAYEDRQNNPPPRADWVWDEREPLEITEQPSQAQIDAIVGRRSEAWCDSCGYMKAYCQCGRE